MGPTELIPSPTSCIGAFAESLQSRRLTADIEFKLGELLLDYLRVASIGARMPWSKWAEAYQNKLGGTGRSHVLYSRKQTNPVQAAFLNAIYAGSIDADDTHVGSMLHPGAVVFSAALALAAEIEPSGRAFLSAVAAGYEAMIRIALSIQPSHFRRGFQSTATCGGFGAATASTMLLYDGAQDTALRVSEALGMVASFAGGLTQFYHSGSTVKRIHAAHAAECGVSAALLVREGFSGPTDILEGVNGFAQAYADDANFNLLTEGLGIDFRLAEVMVKGHACSARIQSAIECIIDLANRHRIAPSDIREIHVGVPSVIVGRLTLHNPIDAQAAQMSLPFSVALALSRAHESGKHVLLEVSDYEDGLKDPEVRAIEERVTWEVDPEVEAGTSAEAVPAKVTIRLKNGQSVSSLQSSPPGSRSKPLTHEEQINRFRVEVGKRLGSSNCDEVIEVAENLPELDSINRLIELLDQG